MGETTGISWTNSTVNPWVGCAKVSAGCAHCYAEHAPPTRTHRAKGLELWGHDANRYETKGWAGAIRSLERKAAKGGEVHRVFVASLSDVFEDFDGRVLRADGSESNTLLGIRTRLFAAMVAAPHLTFQVLTKRPENILRMVPVSWLDAWPAHVWIGCTVENQEEADARIPHLLRVPAPVRFLSVEPQIGPVDLESYLTTIGAPEDRTPPEEAISWIICGGESGSKARPFRVEWMRSMRDQCAAADVPFFPKQLGAHVLTDDRTAWPGGNLPVERLDDVGARIVGAGWRVRLRDSLGGDEAEWPADLRGLRAFPKGGVP